jgi:hypothetical protein
MSGQTVKLPQLLGAIARAARQGDYGTAASLLNRAILLMQAELAAGIASPAILAQATRYLDEMFIAQRRGDWVAFADVLEFGFIDFWHEHFSPPV